MLPMVIRRFTLFFFLTLLFSFGFTNPKEPVIESIHVKEIKVFPNPIQNIGKVEFSLEKAGNIEITLHNILGKQVKLVSKEYYRSGFINIDFDASDLYKGHYFLKISLDSKVQKTMRIYKS